LIRYLAACRRNRNLFLFPSPLFVPLPCLHTGSFFFQETGVVLRWCIFFFMEDCFVRHSVLLFFLRPGSGNGFDRWCPPPLFCTLAPVLIASSDLLSPHVLRKAPVYMFPSDRRRKELAVVRTFFPPPPSSDSVFIAFWPSPFFVSPLCFFSTFVVFFSPTPPSFFFLF